MALVQTAMIVGSVANKQISSHQADQQPTSRSVAAPRISTAHVQTAVILAQTANKQISSQQADQWPYHGSDGRDGREEREGGTGRRDGKEGVTGKRDERGRDGREIGTSSARTSREPLGALTVRPVQPLSR